MHPLGSAHLNEVPTKLTRSVSWDPVLRLATKGAAQFRDSPRPPSHAETTKEGGRLPGKTRKRTSHEPAVGPSRRPRPHKDRQRDDHHHIDGDEQSQPHHAAREGFEPPEGFPSGAFKAPAIGRSATSPECTTVVPEGLLPGCRVGGCGVGGCRVGGCRIKGRVAVLVDDSFIDCRPVRRLVRQIIVLCE